MPRGLLDSFSATSFWGHHDHFAGHRPCYSGFSQVDWWCKATLFSYTPRASENDFPRVSTFSIWSNIIKLHQIPFFAKKCQQKYQENPQKIKTYTTQEIWVYISKDIPNIPRNIILSASAAAAGGNDLGFERLLVFRGLRLLRLVRALRRAVGKWLRIPIWILSTYT